MAKLKTKAKPRRAVSTLKPRGFKGHVPTRSRSNFIKQFRAHLLNKTMSRFRAGSI